MFKLFKKRDSDVLDLTSRKRGQSDIPIPEEMRRKIERTIAASTQTNVISSDEEDTVDLTGSPTDTTNEEPVKTGGFFSNFFGGGSSTETESSIVETIPSTTTNQEPISRSNIIKIRDNFQKLSERISRLTDRIELLEKKIDRIESK